MMSEAFLFLFVLVVSCSGLGIQRFSICVIVLSLASIVSSGIVGGGERHRWGCLSGTVS